MRHPHRYLVLAFLGIGLVTLGGCAETKKADQGAPAATESASSGDTAVAEAMAKLSPEDRAAAEAQKICPVSDEPLGSMGTPIKHQIAGRDVAVFICCEGCSDSLDKEPDRFLAKLQQPAPSEAEKTQ
jgi:hypothetical protein